LDELVYQNCLIVQAAAEAYAAENGGVYADRPADLVDYLPDSALLTNPETNQATEPVFMEPSGLGSTSYRVFGEYGENWDFDIVGYYVVGRGETRDFIVTNITDPEIHMEREQAVVENCQTVHAAVEAFAAENGGAYPYGGVDVNGAGNTVHDYLPEGLLLVNPYTGLRTEPMWGGAPFAPGGSAYQFINSDGGDIDGYLIAGLGTYLLAPVYQVEFPQ